MPRLTYISDRSRFEFLCLYEDRHVAQGNGLQWDVRVNRWYTAQDHIAVRLVEFADDKALAALSGFLQATAASRSVDGELDVPAPDGLQYMPFQLAGIQWCAERKAALLGDDMGLGKTIQGAGIINATAPHSVLVVCPASLKLNWRRELRKWLVDDYRVSVVTSKLVPAAVAGRNIYIINYDLLVKHKQFIRSETWGLLLLDEAHYLKNEQAQRTKVGLSIRAHRKVWMTGTPIENRPVELWTALKYLAPQDWGTDYSAFLRYAKQYCAAHQKTVYLKGGRKKQVWMMDGSSNLDELQARLRSTIMIRRKKHQVLTDLPSKTRQVVTLPPTGSGMAAQLKVEAKALGQLKDAKTPQGVDIAFHQIALVRHQTAVLLAPYACRYIAGLLKDGTLDKVVVFAHHSDVVDIAIDTLQEYNPQVITGATSQADRDGAVNTFQCSDYSKVFIGNIQAAGVGLTLTAATTAIFLELDWSPSKMTQAEDRIWRIGQDNACLIQHLVLDKSISANMAHALTRKQAVIDAAIDNKDATVDWATELLNEGKDR